MTHLQKLLGVAIAAAALAGSASVAHAGSERSFGVNNSNSSYSIQNVWFAQAGTRQAWQTGDMDSPVGPQTRTTFTLSGAASVCFYDVKVRFSDGVEQQFANVNVCRGDYVRAD